MNQKTSETKSFSLLQPIILGPICLILGFLLSNPIRNLFPVSHSFAEETLVTAHNKSVRFRTLEGYCDETIPAGIKNQLGLFTLNYRTVIELNTAINFIRNNYTPSPTDFHCIFGSIDNSNNSVLLVAGLDNTGNEILESTTRPTRSLILPLTNNNQIPCPRLCDISNSTIIKGSRTNSNPCTSLE